MLALVLGMLLFTLRRWPDLPLCRAAQRRVITPLAAALNRLDRRHILFALVLLPVLLGAGELIVLMGSVDAALLLAWDASLFADALIASVALATLRPLRALRPLLARLRPPATPRARRLRRARRAAPPANDGDGPEWGPGRLIAA